MSYAATVDKEGRRAGDVAEIGACDVLRDPSRGAVTLEVVDETPDIEAELTRVGN
jgi:hypothetical protein